MRMGMIKAEHREAAIPRAPARGNVGRRLDQEAVRVVRKIRRPHRLDDRRLHAEQQAAALGRQRVAGVVDDGLERRSGDANGYNASTTIAMPIPPPMHSDATP